MDVLAAEAYAKRDVVSVKKHEQNKDDFLIQEIKNYKMNMFRVAKSILRNDSDAEDAVGESVLTAYTSLFSLKNRDSFRPWVMKILVRECYKIIRKRSTVDYLDTLPDIPVNDVDNTQVLWGYVNSLPHEYRSVIVLFYYEDMSIKTIAQTLSLSQGAVKSRLSRGKARLRQLIEKDGGLGNDGF